MERPSATTPHRLLPLLALIPALTGLPGPARAEPAAAPPAPATAAAAPAPDPAPAPAAAPAPPPAPRPPKVETPENLVAYALELRQAGDDAGARRALDAALAKAPSNGPARLERAELLLDQDIEAAQAEADARQATKLLPEETRAWRALGRALEGRKDFPGASGAYSRALALLEDLALERRVATLEMHNGMEEVARVRWEIIRNAEPEDPGAHVELISLYEKSERWDDAEKEYRALLKLADTPAIHGRFADFLEARGRHGEAAAERRKAGHAPPRPMRPLLPSPR
jgi:Tfp pilus assembly protein PilF